MADKEDDITSNQENIGSRNSLDAMQQGCLAGVGVFCGFFYLLCIALASNEVPNLFLAAAGPFLVFLATRRTKYTAFFWGCITPFLLLLLLYGSCR